MKNDIIRQMVITINEKAKKEVPALAEKVEAEYNATIEKALTTAENNEYLTDYQKGKIKEGKFKVEHYAKSIIAKINKSYKSTPLERLNAAFSDDREIKKITIATDWKKGSMGANQCKAEIRIIYDDYSVGGYDSRRTGGCGYDKESTAIADALNQCNPLIKELCIMANKAIEENKPYREALGYVSGYNVIPYFEGGVGFSCFESILNKAGYFMNHVYWNKRSDVYEFTKK